MSHEKRFEPTPEKLKRARANGDVGKAAEITFLASVTAGYCSCLWLSGRFRLLLAITKEIFGAVACFPSEKLLVLLAKLGLAASEVILMIMLLSFIGAVGAEIAQVGLVVKFPQLNSSKLNLIDGLRRIVGAGGNSSLSFALRVFASGGIYLATIFLVVFGLSVVSPLLVGDTDREKVFNLVIQLIHRFCLLSGFALSLVASGRLLFERVQRRKRLRMDIHEYKQEFKENEGSPEIKAMRRALHQEIARENWRAELRKAKLLVVNRL